MNKVLLRSLTGLVFVVITTGAVTLSAWTFLVFVLVINAIGLIELFRMWLPGNTTAISLVLFISLYYLTMAFLNLQSIFYESGFIAGLPLFFLPFLIQLYDEQNHPMQVLGLIFTGLTYFTFPLFLLIYLAYHQGTYHPWLVLGPLILIWVQDTMAFFVGRKWGRHRLFERISPKKTWEGAIGGGFFTLVTAWIIATLDHSAGLIQWLPMGFIVILAGNFGDLTESMFKRSLGLKDSGELIPGHGGILDRFDAFVFTLPFLFPFVYCCY